MSVGDSKIDSVYFRDIGSAPLLSAEEEKELAMAIARGDAQARNQLVVANLRLVVSVARDFRGRGLPLQDLISEGNLGLIRAAEKFDPAAGVKFSTYAVYWIKQSILRALMSKARTIRVPVYMAELLHKWRRAARVLEVELGREPEPEEVAKFLGLAPEKLESVKAALRADNFRHSFLQKSETEGNLEWIQDERIQLPGAKLFETEDLKWAMRRLESLNKREADVLRLRFGLNNEQPWSLSEIGEVLGLTRERIRQIEEVALRKIRTGFGLNGKPKGQEVDSSKSEVTAVEAAAILGCSPKRFREIAKGRQLEPSGRRHGDHGLVERLWRMGEVRALAMDRKDRLHRMRKEAPADGRELISTREAAAIFGLSRSCFQSTRPCGLNPVVSKVGYGALWDAAEVRRFAAQRQIARKAPLAAHQPCDQKLTPQVGAAS